MKPPFCKGGAYEASNLQIIYASENRKKKDSLSYKPNVVFRLIETKQAA